MYFYISPASEDLQHHGVIGMKWGIRKAAASSQHVSKAAQSAKNLRKDLKRSKKPEDLSKMSDQELRDKINRMQLEENYNRLVNSREAAKGSQFVDRALDTVGDVALLAGSIASIILIFQKKES